ncbi:MAG TPA: GntR family transcriptional regulator [Anaerolineae bacterium]|nr:GntR family transcriptional regulator [Anaerolineae bacterium]
MRPIERAEFYLLEKILKGFCPPGSNLLGERKFESIVGVTRSNLRKALRRIEKDGWVKIQQGKPIIINNYWQTGEINILSSMDRLEIDLTIRIVDGLLEARATIAPFS